MPVDSSIAIDTIFYRDKGLCFPALSLTIKTDSDGIARIPVKKLEDYSNNNIGGIISRMDVYATNYSTDFKANYPIYLLLKDFNSTRVPKSFKYSLDYSPQASVTEPLLKGYSVRDIALHLNAQGITTRNGNVWSYSNTAYSFAPNRLKFLAGYDKHGNKGDWPSIISESFMQRILDIKIIKKSAPLTKKNKFLLSGIDRLKCGYCEDTVKTSAAPKTGHKYYI